MGTRSKPFSMVFTIATVLMIYLNLFYILRDWSGGSKIRNRVQVFRSYLAWFCSFQGAVLLACFCPFCPHLLTDPCWECLFLCSQLNASPVLLDSLFLDCFSSFFLSDWREHLLSKDTWLLASRVLAPPWGQAVCTPITLEVLEITVWTRLRAFLWKLYLKKLGH